MEVKKYKERPNIKIEALYIEKINKEVEKELQDFVPEHYAVRMLISREHMITKDKRTDRLICIYKGDIVYKIGKLLYALPERLFNVEYMPDD